jgi:hypothetical protein
VKLTLQRKLVLIVSGLGAVLVAVVLSIVSDHLTVRAALTAREDADNARLVLDDSLHASVESYRFRPRSSPTRRSPRTR